ncbi:MAG: DUF1868 domain-containing protein [Pseudomonadota bacterium]
MTVAPFDYHAFARSQNADPVRFVGTRYDSAGSFLTERGNTIVRHVVPGSATEQAMIELRSQMQAGPLGPLLALTDVESYHMTLFNGAIETSRTPDTWPVDVPLDADVNDTTVLIQERLATFEGPASFAMRPVEVTPFGLTLTGATDVDEATARAWRDSLPAHFGYRSTDHEAYIFHTTVAYLKDWLPDEVLLEAKAFYARLTDMFLARVSMMDLGPPCFCTFEDMNWFEPLIVLPGSAVEMPTLRRPG